ncbi:hypothetical protein Q3W71_10515 [Micromonospora sp. C28SCA-DRY-2]|uniref:hypothetical protein n=1 Tax=Micromonospora sp. C28SCA-DRY-2 TaxID=3059522 RepID=UPI0026758577|nr:hypothetical protein [Micromonospora sp. C28SCA-DRY-2]MDO3702110.1 hypothetical protein [Micromonospora sp. C28SCA-DRY-2]
MLLDPDAENEVAYELCQLVGRAILPFRGIGQVPATAGTAFFFRDPVGEYLLTADALTDAPLGELGLRASLTEPAGAAGDVVPAPESWLHRTEIGVAILPTAGLHEDARRAGWRWRTQQVTDGVAAGSDVVTRIGAAPGSAFVLANGVREDGSRPLEVAIERVVRAGDAVRITTELPPGYVGAPVFGVQADAAGEVALHCLGLVLPATVGGHPVATFDRVRAAIPAAPGAA